MYRVSSYFWGKIFTELPLGLIIPIVQSALIYFTVGFRIDQWYKFPCFVINIILIYNSFSGIGYVLGATFSDAKVINILSPIFVVPMMLFAGYFVNQNTIPVFLTPFKWISIFRYGYQAFFFNEFNDPILELDCLTEEDPRLRCNPVDDYDSPMTMYQSWLAMLTIWVVTFILAFCIMKKLST